MATAVFCNAISKPKLLVGPLSKFSLEPLYLFFLLLRRLLIFDRSRLRWLVLARLAILNHAQVVWTLIVWVTEARLIDLLGSLLVIIVWYYFVAKAVLIVFVFDLCCRLTLLYDIFCLQMVLFWLMRKNGINFASIVCRLIWRIKIKNLRFMVLLSHRTSVRLSIWLLGRVLLIFFSLARY